MIGPARLCLRDSTFAIFNQFWWNFNCSTGAPKQRARGHDKIWGTVIGLAQEREPIRGSRSSVPSRVHGQSPHHWAKFADATSSLQVSIIAVFLEYLRQFLIDLNQIYRHSKVPKHVSVHFLSFLAQAVSSHGAAATFFCHFVRTTV